MWHYCHPFNGSWDDLWLAVLTRGFRVARDEISHINVKASLVGIVGLKTVMGMPDLIINGEVMYAGKVTVKSRIIEWLEEVKSTINQGG